MRALFLNKNESCPILDPGFSHHNSELGPSIIDHPVSTYPVSSLFPQILEILLCLQYSLTAS